MNILHNWQLNLYTLKLQKIFVCQDPVLRQIAAGVRAQSDEDERGAHSATNPRCGHTRGNKYRELRVRET